MKGLAVDSAYAHAVYLVTSPCIKPQTLPTSMKNKLLPFCLLLVVSANAWSRHEQLDALNQKRSAAIRQKDHRVLISFYDPEAVCMPEFHPALTGSSSISQYFRQWIDGYKSSSYQSHTQDIIERNGFIIEAGIFTDTIINIKDDTLIYEGKYLRQWKRSGNNEWRILSEIWGAANYPDRSRFPYTGDGQPVNAALSLTGSTVENEVIQRNRLIAKLVAERKGTEHAKLFTDDAIYMPYYLPMQKGMNNILAYFAEHEKPDGLIIDSISIKTGKVIVMEDLVMEHGYYGVVWVAPDKSSGIVTGKSLNIWKRNEKGVLLLYRQMVNHN
jgi:ketosteroid isomerase-like protein